MAHFVYKKSLQNEKVRAKYVDEHRELKNLKNSGALDIDTYRNAKRCIEHSLVENGLGLGTSQRTARSVRSSGASSSSSDSAGQSATASRSRKGTIFDRSNVAARIFLADAQSEEQRRALKFEKKIEERIKADAHLAALSLEGSVPFEAGLGDMIRRPSEASYVTSTRSSSISSQSGQRSVNVSKQTLFLRKSPSSRGRPVVPSPVIREGFEFNFGPQPLPSPGTPPLLAASSPQIESPTTPILFSTNGDLWGGRNTGSEWSRYRPRADSIDTISSIPIISRKGSIDSLVFPSLPPLAGESTWADRWLLNGTRTTGSRITLDKQYAISIISRGQNRRHSFSSQSRPSFASDDSRRMSELATISSELCGDSPFPANHSQTSLPYGLSNGYDDVHYTPPSMLLLDMFAAVLNGFDNTSKLFDYARKDAPRHYQSSRASSITGESIHHPGKLVVFDEEMQKLKHVVKDKLWFLMTLKWQYFGRVLFSPGHHLLHLGKVGYGSRPSTAEELRILDLDGPMTADWAWHCAYEYPDAIVYSLTTSTNETAISPLTTQFMPPPNQRRIQIPSLTDLSSLPSNSFDAISSRTISRYIKKSDWLPLLRECHRLLKHDGYIEFTIVDPVLNSMGPQTRQWILDNILKNEHPRMFDIMPSKTLLKILPEAGFDDIGKVWVWVPATSIGDELSTVTSMMGRYLYDEVYGSSSNDEDEGIQAPKEHMELGLWSDEVVMEECAKNNTAFRWLKCHASKKDLAAV
ncbi:hypothetical protein EX30DRAFT_395938 [Ascodesmis nigricans]|uniref:Methyltransferase type 11 domain-containing protein n=1 Tax=Ascodesmis nigricans TaxID=341454 RepID=A0A4S2MWY4_9PEZI|nr:hypothetical protein EX30DRAFT_395938 [Ascodesmis nigricans]